MSEPGSMPSLPSARAWIGGLKVGIRTERSLHEGDGKGAIIKAWTGLPEMFRVMVSVPGKSSTDLNVRLKCKRFGSGEPTETSTEAWEIPMVCEGEKGDHYLFAAGTTFASPGFFTLTAVLSWRAEGRWTGAIAVFDEGQAALVIVHPGWARGARIFEAYTRYFGARRDAAGEVVTGKIRDLIDNVARFKNLGFEALWAMGVFDRGRKDIKGIGSPYAIRDHRRVDEELGTEADLKELGEALHAAGLRFGVDFVGNQTSWDCELLDTHPDWYEGMRVTGRDAKRSERELAKRHPLHRVVQAQDQRWLIRQGHSRYEEWQDVAQLNWNVAELREHMRETVLDLIRRYDVDFFRCDMAMLIQKCRRYEENGEEHWEERWPGMGAEWWREVIAAAVQLKPEIVFIAEVYWGNDRYLQELGFALTYDHGFYHHLIGEKWGKDLKNYLEEQREWLPHGAATLHYIENHDELRIGETTGEGRILSALMNLFTEDGGVMVYNGQMEGEPLKPSLDAPWHDAPGHAVDEARWKMHEEMLYLGRRHPELRRGETIHLPVGEESPYRAFVRCLDPQRSMIVVVNHSTARDSPSPLLLLLPAGELEIVEDRHAHYRLFGVIVTPGLHGEDPLLFEPVEYLRTGRSLAKEGLPLALRGNSGCFLRIVPAPDGPAPSPAAYGSVGEMRADLEGLVRFHDDDVLFEEFLIFKHEKLAPVAVALTASDPALRESAMRLLLAYSRLVSPFPQRFPIGVRSPASREIFLSLGDEGRFALCLPANVLPAELAPGSVRTWVGEKRCGLVPFYLEGVREGNEIALKIEVQEGRPVCHRDHLLMKNREFERISRLLTIVCRKPGEGTIFLEEGATVEIEVAVEGAIEDDRRVSLYLDTTLANGVPSPRLLHRDEKTESYTAPSFRAEIDGWHPVTLSLVDEWTGIRRSAREISINVVPAWSVGFNAYTIWLRHIRRPGKGADERADFADLRWNIEHAHAMGFDVVLLLPITDCLGSSPYEQICAMALDPAYLIMEEFLRVAPPFLFPEEGDGSDRADFAAFVEENDWVDEYADVKAIRILTYGDRLYTEAAGGFYRMFMRVMTAMGGPAREFSLPDYQGMDEEGLRATKIYRALRRLIPVQQYIARRQLREVLSHAHRSGVRVLFDQPLFPGTRSAEVLHHPERFVAERGIVSPDGTQTWPFVRYDWEYERARGYADYLAPFACFIEELGFDGFRWDAFHTILLDGQEELLRRMAARFNGRGILKLGEQLGANEEEVNPLLLRYGYLLYFVPWWYPGGGFADTVEKLEERIMLADGGSWWLASSLHDHPRITEWYAPLVARYGRLPRQHQAPLARMILALFAFFPNFIIFYGAEYAARQRINTPGDAWNTWDAPPPWAEELDNPDLTSFVDTLNRVRERYPELRRPGGRMILDSDAKEHGVLSLALVAGTACFILITCFSPRRVRARVTLPFAALGIDPARPFVLQDLLSGKEMKFLPGKSGLKEEGTILVSLHFGDAYLFRTALHPEKTPASFR